MWTRTFPFLLLVVLAPPACGGGGQYGYSREYEPLDEEEDPMEAATPTTWEEVHRDPRDYRSQLLAWFGVVENVDTDGSGRARVLLSYRTHQERHLCSDELASSCRVTITDRSTGPFTAVLTMHPEDRQGEARLWTGSLLKVYGSPTGEFDAQGGPVLQVRYYRHWPRGTYVTTGARGSMRR